MNPLLYALSLWVAAIVLVSLPTAAGRRRLGHALTQLGLVFNQAIHMVLSFLLPWAWRTMWADETMSSRAWRSEQRGKGMGRLMRPVIDALFWWQEIDPRYTGHCHQAWARERSQDWRPPEQRDIEQEVKQ
jgi:hypothetical protein